MASRAAISRLARLYTIASRASRGGVRVFGVLPPPLSVASRGQLSVAGNGSLVSPLSTARRMSSTKADFATKSPFNNLKTKAVGKELEFRMNFEHPDVGDGVSPWHDLPYKVSNSTFTLVNEIPKGQRAKMEVQPKEKGNPIKQDVKKGKPRYFQFGDIPFNYGMIPQTWEDPRVQDKDSGCNGDGDPLDVVEISASPFPIGSTHEIKVLGALGLVDEGEMDWKIVAIGVHNPLAGKLNSVEDVEKQLPGTLTQIRHWFRFYKIAEGKAVNAFAFNGEFRGASFATSLIEHHHKQYADLIKDGPKDTKMWTKKSTHVLKATPKQ